MSGHSDSHLSPHEEDWSIISSSSDIEDDPSTASFPIDNSSEEKNQESNSIDHSILQVPELRTSMESSKSTVKVRDSMNLAHEYTDLKEVDDDIVDSGDSPFTPSTSSETKSDSVDICVNVAPKINFYENLSKFNDSIKQRSNEFYSNYAKVKMDQLNNYLSEQQSGIEEEEHEVSRSEEVKTESEETSESHFDSSEISTPSLCSVVQPSSLPYWKRGLGTTVDYMKNFLDRNSAYLYYYFLGITFAFVSLGLGIHYFKPTPVEQPLTTIGKFNQLWDSIIYEEEIVPPKLFIFSKKKQKVNKFTKFSVEFENKFFDVSDKFFKNFWYNKKFEEFSNQLNEFYVSTNEKLNPLINEVWEDAKIMEQETLKNLEELSKFGFDNFGKYSKVGWTRFKYNGKNYYGLAKEYGKKGWFKVDEYSNIGWSKFKSNGNDFLDWAKEYGKECWFKADEYSDIGYKYVSRGTNEVLKHSKSALSVIDSFMEKIFENISIEHVNSEKEVTSKTTTGSPKKECKKQSKKHVKKNVKMKRHIITFC